MIVIKIILWALLAVLLIVILALFIPAGAVINYSDDVTVTIKYLFLKFVVVGDKKEKPKKKRKQVPEEKKTVVKDKHISEEKKTIFKEKTVTQKDKTVITEKSIDKKTKSKTKNKKEPKKENAVVKWIKTTFKEKGLSGLLNAFKEIAKLAETFLKPIFKHIKIKRLDLNVTVAFDDAADTAVKYGYFCSGIYPALAVLLRIMKYDDYSVNIAPDFDKKEPEFDVYADLRILPWFIVVGAVKALIDYLILKNKGKL